MDFDVKKVENSRKKYKKYNETLQNLFNEKTKDKLYYAFGFNDEEVIDKLNGYGLNLSELVSIGYGGYLKKEYVDYYKKLNKYIYRTKKEFLKDYYNICGMYYDRLWDFEARYGFEGYNEAINSVMCYLDVNNIKDLNNDLLYMLTETISIPL